MIHRLGSLAVTDSAVVVAVSAPHRDAAFEAGRFVIDTLKETVPIWKHETWRDGADWGTGAAPIRDVQRVAGGAA
jgi:molybdopterin synthase catalytic subunit